MRPEPPTGYPRGDVVGITTPTAHARREHKVPEASPMMVKRKEIEPVFGQCEL